MVVEDSTSGVCSAEGSDSGSSGYVWEVSLMGVSDVRSEGSSADGSSLEWDGCSVFMELGRSSGNESHEWSRDSVFGEAVLADRGVRGGFSWCLRGTSVID